MRSSLSIAMLLLVLTTVPCARAHADPDKPTIEQLRARADTATGEHCADVCLDAATALVEQSNDLFTSGDVEKAHLSMKDAVVYARKAADGSVQSRKRQKKTEISLRKLAKRISDIRQTLAVDDRPALDEAIQSIEKMRTDLLMSMFSEK